MDRSLWLLIRLRAFGWIRRVRRNLLSPRGAALAFVGVLLLVPLIASMFISPAMQGKAQFLFFRRFGPLAVLGFCLLSVVLSSDERALAFSPAEIDFLFPAPFQRRTLLAYRIVVSLGVACVSAAFMTLVVGRHGGSLLASFVSLFLATELIYLITLIVGLFSSVIDETTSGRRHVSLIVGTALILVVFVTWDRQSFGLASGNSLRRLARSPVVNVLSLPFRPFVNAFTSTAPWPELATWSAIGFAEVLTLIGILLMIDVDSYETVTNANARDLARLEGTRIRGRHRSSRMAALRPAGVPWWGGIGPNFWRHGLFMLRQPARLLTVASLFLVSMISIYVAIKGGRYTARGQEFWLAASALILHAILFGPTILGLDLRSDSEYIDELKSLPIPPLHIVLGELATPCVILILGQWFTLAILALLIHLGRWHIIAVSLLIVPVNILFVEIENLFFLWFPIPRPMGFTLDFPTLGRQCILILAKLAFVTTILVAAAMLGWAAYFSFGRNWTLGFATALLVTLATCASLLPMLTSAFVKFDVSRGSPL